MSDAGDEGLPSAIGTVGVRLAAFAQRFRGFDLRCGVRSDAAASSRARRGGACRIGGAAPDDAHKVGGGLVGAMPGADKSAHRPPTSGASRLAVAPAMPLPGRRGASLEGRRCNRSEETLLAQAPTTGFAVTSGAQRQLGSSSASGGCRRIPGGRRKRGAAGHSVGGGGSGGGRCCKSADAGPAALPAVSCADGNSLCCASCEWGGCADGSSLPCVDGNSLPCADVNSFAGGSTTRADNKPEDGGSESPRPGA